MSTENGLRSSTILASSGPLFLAKPCAIGVAAMHSSIFGNLILRSPEKIVKDAKQELAMMLDANEN